MNIIKQVKSSFGELEIDFYLDRNRNIFVTIEQLAQGFGYKSRNAIEKMIERQPYLKEKRFSVTDKLSARENINRNRFFSWFWEFRSLQKRPIQMEA